MPATIETQGNALTYETIEPEAGSRPPRHGTPTWSARRARPQGRGSVPTGMKELLRAEKAQKYIIYNADEGAAPSRTA
jgi:hypothetical protein